MIPTEKPGTPTELVHHGVKGMKWGVRKGYTQRRGAEAARLRRVGEGSATFKDRIKVHSKLSPLEIALGQGGKKTSLRKAQRLEGHVERVANGKANVADKLTMFGNVRLTDIRKK